jgi:omega-6 fatty acid desaturase (delta-12 desaturase)
MRSGKELLIASNRYAREQPLKSWWHFLTTVALAAILLTAACMELPFAVCLFSSIVGSLVLVRLFIIYHDHMHGTILVDSRIAGSLLRLYGLLVLSPPQIWKHSHDDHHKHNARKFGPTLGTFPVMSTSDYALSTRQERFMYAVTRHPLTILFGYLTIFFWEMTLYAFILNPKKHYDGAISILLHLAVAVALSFVSWQALFLGMLLPMSIITCLGSYLFYAQHNFPGMTRRHGSEWDHVYAALNSSSFMKMGRIMHWFTGNIGYHHVHHLNAKIPFYRLPEAMAGLPELQSPQVTTLSPVDIVRCLRLKLWDPTGDRLLTFREASRCHLNPELRAVERV